MQPIEAIREYRDMVLASEEAWKEVIYQAGNGEAFSIQQAREAFQALVLKESRALDAVFEHIHQIDCCSNEEEVRYFNTGTGTGR